MRLIAKPEGARPVLFGFDSSEEAGACVADVIGAGIVPVAIEFMDKPAIEICEAFAKAGCDGITVHAEAGPHLDRSLQAIRGLGKRAGVAINPATSESVLEYLLDKIDLVLVMTVNPGFGGQKFITAMEEKIRRVRAMIGDRPIELEVDGGIAVDTIAMPAASGANVFVAGSAIFGGGHVDAYRKTIDTLRSNAEGARA